MSAGFGFNVINMNRLIKNNYIENENHNLEESSTNNFHKANDSHSEVCCAVLWAGYKSERSEHKRRQKHFCQKTRIVKTIRQANIGGKFGLKSILNGEVNMIGTN